MSGGSVNKTEKIAIGKGGTKLPYPGPGRPKGKKNKFTSLKDAYLDAFVGLGGAKGLTDWAKKSEANRRVFYQMICKMLPTNIDIDARAVVDHLLSFKFSENGNGDSNGDKK